MRTGELESKLLPVDLPPVDRQSIFERYDILKVFILFGWPILTTFAVYAHVTYEGMNWWLFFLGFFLARIAQLSISAGYHRYYSHRSYNAHPILQLFFLFFGASAVQNSALKWANDHRRHHLFSDKKEDPYPITHGLFYAHMGWIMDNNKKRHRRNLVNDLLKEPLVLWQHKNYKQLLVINVIVLPLIIGYFINEPIGTFAFLGLFKSLIAQHTTFCINSFAHYWGRRPFDKKSSATDNPILAVIAMGDGYHNYHHFAPGDYRCGISKWAWDTSKWFIYFCSKIGLAGHLKRVH